MIRAPSRHEILLAEQHLMQTRHEMAAGVLRLETAVRATLARPSTLLGVAGAAGVAGYLLFRRPRLRVEHAGPSNGASATVASTSMTGIIVAFALRYAMQQLPAMGLRLVEHAMRKRAIPRTSVVPPPYRSATTLQ